MTQLKLWYRQPATQWVEALPLGNGRLGAMAFGGVGTERLQLNEDTLWAGGPYSPVNPEALPHLDEVRALLVAGRYADAEALADRYLMSIPLKQMPYQPAGDLLIETGHTAAGDYVRCLDLDTAIATTRYMSGGTSFTRDLFISPVDNVLVLRITSDRPAAINLRVTLTSPQQGRAVADADGVITFVGRNRAAENIAGALSFAMAAAVSAVGGTVSWGEEGIGIVGADSVLVLLDIGTNFQRFDTVGGDPLPAVRARLAAAAQKGYDTLRAAHIAEHQRLFRRLSIDLGSTPAAELPTDVRIARGQPADDPSLASIYVQFARYLMIASSRPGTQPANLQGIWNDLLDPPWGSKYTANINLQMNYWLPDLANISECVEPLVRMAEELSVTGAEMAKAHYGSQGWVMHHNTDLWRATGPIDGAKWGLWPTGGAWLCAQLVDHLRFAWQDDIARRLLPVMEGAVRFILDALITLPSGERVTAPSLSPENVHPFGAALCAGPTMDSAIIRDLFVGLTEVATRLGVAVPLAEQMAAAEAQLPRPKIGSAGQLQEWREDWDLDVPEIHHRHVSHLYGLYPSLQIDIDATPALAAAVRRSLEIRGDNATGWGIGWRINLWARLRDGDHAHEVVALLLGPERTYPNMFDAHPPFQIDGNFGGAAGILEMLVQSRPGEIHLLPALPSAWPEGELRGVRARGGISVEMTWSKGRLASLALCADTEQTITLMYGTVRTIVLLPAGRWIRPKLN